MPTTRHYKCLGCKDQPEFETSTAVLVHLHEVHGFEPELNRLPGERQDLSYMDGRGWSEERTLWTFTRPVPAGVLPAEEAPVVNVIEQRRTTAEAA